MTLPSIDFDRPNILGADLDRHFSDLGFASLQNLNIQPDFLDQVFAASEGFFLSSAPDAFQRCRYKSAEENFGYQGLMEENLDPTQPADVKATFTMRNILHQPPSLDRWPSRAFRDVMVSFYAQALATAHQLQTEMATIFGLDPEFFVSCHSGENVTLRLLYYPAIEGEQLDKGQLGAGAHSDYGFLTLLFQKDRGGLEVLDKENQWLSVPPEPGKVVLNCGDLLERWTCGKYKSTLHRVKPQTGSAPRFSIAFFVDTDSETMVSPIAKFAPNGDAAEYPSILAGEFIQRRLNASHKGRFED